MKTRIIISITAIVLLVSIAFTLLSNKRTVEQNVYRPDPEKKILVRADTARLIHLKRPFSYTGTFVPNREVMLVSQIQGEVTGVYFEEGDVVHAGKPLIQIDDHILRAQHDAAKANYETAKRNLERYETASKSGGVSNLQLDNLKLNLATTESQLKQLSRQIELSRIEAPFTGTITMRSVEPGSVAGQGPLARITDLSELKLEISVPEKEIALFKHGEETQIVSELFPGKKIAGRVTYVSDRADDAHNYDVKILVRNDRNSTLKAGMYGTVVLTKAMNDKTLVISRAALLGSAKNPQVFVAADGRVSLRNIRTGFSTNESVEVLDGLAENDVVVITGHINLAEGSFISIANK